MVIELRTRNLQKITAECEGALLWCSSHPSPPQKFGRTWLTRSLKHLRTSTWKALKAIFTGGQHHECQKNRAAWILFEVDGCPGLASVFTVLTEALDALEKICFPQCIISTFHEFPGRFSQVSLKMFLFSCSIRSSISIADKSKKRTPEKTLSLTLRSPRRSGGYWRSSKSYPTERECACQNSAQGHSSSSVRVFIGQTKYAIQKKT